MKHDFQPLKQVKTVLTYLLTLTTGQRYILVPCDAHGSIMEETGIGTDTMRAHLWSGGTVEIPMGSIFAVEQDRYRVSIFNGQTTRSQDVSEENIGDALSARADKNTGEVQVREVFDRQTGERISTREHQLPNS
jgi:hypothetical protein